MLDRGERGSAGAAFEAGDGHMVRHRLGHAGRDRPDADLGDELHRDVALGVDVLEIEDELLQVLDRIDVVMRRRRNQPDARRRVPNLGDRGIDFMARELATLAGLRSLRHLDLHHVGIDEVLGGHAEAPRGHLLDLRAHRVAVRQRPVAIGFLAAFTRVRLAADPVHGDGKRGMRLAADRAERHGAGREALDDLLGRLDLVERHRGPADLVGALDAEHATQRQELLGLLVDLLGVGTVLLRQTAAHGMLEVRDHRRAPHMRLAADAIGVFAADIERVAQHRRGRKGKLMPFDGLTRDLLESHAFDLAVRAREVFGDEVRPESDGIEDLRAAIGLVGGDAHLRHHLEDALVDRLDVALDRFLGGDLLVEIGQHGLDGLEGEIGIDRLGTVACERAELMHLVGLAGLDHEADRGPEPAADEVMMHRARREQRWDRHAVGTGGAVGQDDDVFAGANGLFGAAAKRGECSRHARGPVIGAIGDVERDGAELVVGHLADAANPLEILVGENRVRCFEPLLLRGALEIEQVRPRPDEGHERHDQLLADRVDRRVRHLGEILLEIGVQKLRPRGERRERRVGAHRADSLLA